MKSSDKAYDEELQYLLGRNQKSRRTGRIYMPTPEEIEEEKRAIREENAERDRNLHLEHVERVRLARLKLRQKDRN